MPQAPDQYKSEWAYVEETAWGTIPGAPETKRLPVISGDLGLERKAKGPGYKHDNRSQGKGFPGKYNASGKLTLALQLENIGTILKHALGGTVQTTGVGPYTHIIPGGDLPPGFTIEKWLADLGAGKSYRYPGSRINALRLNFSGDQLKAELDILSKTESSSATRLDTTPTLVLSADLDPFTATIKRGGVAVPSLIEGGTFVLENNLNADEYILTSNDRYALKPGARNVSFTGMKSFFEDETYYTKFLNAAEDSVELYIALGTLSLKIEILSVLFHGKPISEGTREKGGSLTETYDGTGNPDAANNNVKVTLVNSQATI